MINVLFVCTGNSCRSQMAEVMAVFRSSRDAIRERIADLIGRLEAGNNEGEET